MTVVSWPHMIPGRVLSLDGRLRAPVDREIRHQVRMLLRRGERHIILDLTRVSSIDAAGLGELIRTHNMARAVNGAVRIVNPNRRVRHAIVRAGLDAFLLQEPGVRPLLPELPSHRDYRTLSQSSAGGSEAALKAASAHLREAPDAAGCQIKNLSTIKRSATHEG